MHLPSWNSSMRSSGGGCGAVAAPGAAAASPRGGAARANGGEESSTVSLLPSRSAEGSGAIGMSTNGFAAVGSSCDCRMSSAFQRSAARFAAAPSHRSNSCARWRLVALARPGVTDEGRSALDPRFSCSYHARCSVLRGDIKCSSAPPEAALVMPRAPAVRCLETMSLQALPPCTDQP
eukprot:7387685-Prymnesium_polylepis.1